MKGLIYWMLFQMLLGIWLLISPFAMGFKEMTGVALNNMLLGAAVSILGLGIFLYETSESEAFSGMESGLHVSSTPRKL